MTRYRYLTAALAGPWRESQAEALDDAVAANQARFDTAEPVGIRWAVPGRIEQVEGGGELRNRIVRH